MLVGKELDAAEKCRCLSAAAAGHSFRAERGRLRARHGPQADVRRAAALCVRRARHRARAFRDEPPSVHEPPGSRCRRQSPVHGGVLHGALPERR